MKLVVLGLSLTSSWGNGHATTYRGLLREFAKRGHTVVFLERDQPWYAAHRDLADPDFCTVDLYSSLEDLRERHGSEIESADAVVVGSYVPEGIAVGQYVTGVARGITAFYDIDTPITLADLEKGSCAYIDKALIRRYDQYLSFTGGPTLERLEKVYGAPEAHALYCSVDPAVYAPQPVARAYGLGYLGTYSADRQPTLDRLLLQAARLLPEERFLVAGSQYPAMQWPGNVERREHLPPGGHSAFYSSQRWTLNITRAAMVAAGWSPSVRLFEAAACGVPIISDYWPGLGEFFAPGTEILVAKTPEDTVEFLTALPESKLRDMGSRARERILSTHTAAHRAAELERYLGASASTSSTPTLAETVPV